MNRENQINKTLLTTLPDAQWLISAPGRVNLLGEHVDYNQGIVLPAAIDKRTWLVAKEIQQPELIIHALDLDQKIIINISQINERIDSSGDPLPSWALYPAAVAWIFLSKGFNISGIKAVFSSDIPKGVGLSSSAAIEVAFAIAFQMMNDIKMDRMQLAKLCQMAENQYVGVNCGLMDQFASAHGVARYALYFDTRSLEWQPIPIPQGLSLVIANSMVKRELASSKYNERFLECQKAVKILSRRKSEIQSLRDLSVEEFHQLKTELPEVIRKRVRHVVEEIERVKKSTMCLVSDDAAGFGKLMLAGHQSLRDLYQVSCKELDFLVDKAVNIEGCYGARLTGAGFGGCTINLVQEEFVEGFIQKMRSAYRQEFDLQIPIYTCKADRGAFSEKL